MNNKIKFAEFEKGKVYALPIEEVSPDHAKQIMKIATCIILLLPQKCFNLTIAKTK